MGTKNFATFAPRNRTNHEIRYVRQLISLNIEPALPLMPGDPLSSRFNFWEISISARAFVYNQVRRIVGSLIALGSGRLTERDINIMLHVPSHLNWPSSVNMAPPQGLYLKSVVYDKEHLASCTIKSMNVAAPPAKLAVVQ